MQLFNFPVINFYDEEEVTEMPVTESRVKKIEATISDLTGRVGSLSVLNGQVKGLLVVMGLLVTITIGGGGFIAKEVFDQGKDLASVKQDILNIKENFKDVKQLILGQRLSQASTDPKNPLSVKEVTNVLSSAKQQQLRIDPEIIKETGNKFIATATTQPESWQAVKGYLNYRSFLNASLVPSLAKIKPQESIPNRSVHGNIYIKGFGKVDPEKSARFETMGESHKVRPTEPEYMVITGDSDSKIVLDSKYIKNSVISGLHIVYQGGPTRLENVYFVNCTFDFQIGPKEQQLGKSILASASVNFESPV